MKTESLRLALHRAVDAFIDALDVEDVAPAARSPRKRRPRVTMALPIKAPEIDEFTRARAHAALRRVGINPE